MLDEPSLGLGPAVVEQIFDVVRQACGRARAGCAAGGAERARLAADHRSRRRHPAGRVFLEEGVEQMRQRTDYWDLF